MRLFIMIFYGRLITKINFLISIFVQFIFLCLISFYINIIILEQDNEQFNL